MVVLSAFSIQVKAVTPPSNATIENDWMCSFVMHTTSGDETVSELMSVAFSGNDVYFYLPNPITGNTWVKGTLDNGLVTFAKGQLIGNYSGSVYMVGQDEQGISDVIFGYDEQNHKFMLANQQIVLNSSATEIGSNTAWAYYTDMTVVKGGEEQVDSWTLTGQNVNPADETQYWTLNEQVNVTIEGNNITIYGLGVEETAGLKGTISGNTATFAKNQSAGSYGGTEYFFIGYAGAGAIDIVFDYDAENSVLTARSWILAVDADSNTILLLKNISLSKGNGTTPVTPEDPVVEAPTSISLSDYLFKATSIQYDNEGGIAGMETVQYNVRVGFQGNDVYIQGLFESMPLACVKGTKNADGDYVFTSGQYYGHHPDIESQRFYFCGQIFGGLSDVEMSYDKTSRVFSGGSYYILVNSAKNSLAPYYVFAGVTISKIADKAAVPATPSVVQYAAFNDDYGYGFVCFDVPATDKDGNAIAREKLNYKMYVQKEGVQDAYVFKPALYKNLSNDMSLVPYFFSDGYDFMLGGSQVCFYEESKEWEKIGVQSVYSGGYVNNNSDICWYDIKSGESGITQIVNSKSVNSKCYDLQGRKIVNSKSVNSKSARGIYIVNGKKVVR